MSDVTHNNKMFSLRFSMHIMFPEFVANFAYMFPGIVPLGGLRRMVTLT